MQLQAALFAAAYQPAFNSVRQNAGAETIKVFILYHEKTLLMRALLPALCLLAQVTLHAQQPAIVYTVDSASIEQAGVPKGEMIRFVFDQSKIFPGTRHECSVYVPVQYKADKG